jgi:hypothetical protein
MELCAGKCQWSSMEMCPNRHVHDCRTRTQINIYFVWLRDFQGPFVCVPNLYNYLSSHKSQWWASSFVPATPRLLWSLCWGCLGISPLHRFVSDRTFFCNIQQSSKQRHNLLDHPFLNKLYNPQMDPIPVQHAAKPESISNTTNNLHASHWLSLYWRLTHTQ